MQALDLIDPFLLQEKKWFVYITFSFWDKFGHPNLAKIRIWSILYKFSPWISIHFSMFLDLFDSHFYITLDPIGSILPP